MVKVESCRLLAQERLDLSVVLVLCEVAFNCDRIQTVLDLQASLLLKSQVGFEEVLRLLQQFLGVKSLESRLFSAGVFVCAVALRRLSALIDCQVSFATYSAT